MDKVLSCRELQLRSAKLERSWRDLDQQKGTSFYITPCTAAGVRGGGIEKQKKQIGRLNDAQSGKRNRKNGSMVKFSLRFFSCQFAREPDVLPSELRGSTKAGQDRAPTFYKHTHAQPKPRVLEPGTWKIQLY